MEALDSLGHPAHSAQDPGYLSVNPDEPWIQFHGLLEGFEGLLGVARQTVGHADLELEQGRARIEGGGA